MRPAALRPPAAAPGNAAVPAGWRHPLRALRGRLQRWWHSRLPLTDTLVLTQRNVYILPTRPGWMLALPLLLLLVASINYQLNLGYLLTFLLAGCAVVGVYVCHANLRGLTLHLGAPAPVHAGQAAALDIRLSSERRRPRYGIGLGGLGGAPAGGHAGRAAALDIRLSSERRRPRYGIGLGVLGERIAGPADAHLAWTDVPAQGSALLQVAWAPPARGLHRLPPLTALTLFPLGTFRVWTVWRPAAQVLVYPAPEAHPPPLPPGEPLAGSSGAARVQSTGEFDGVRAYRRGDPLKAVVWKKAAQTFAAGRDDLVSRDALSTQRQQLWLDFAHTGASDLEARLSRLTAWVLMAEGLGLDYGLRLPGRELAPDQGPGHRADCLEALALV